MPLSTDKLSNRFEYRTLMDVVNLNCGDPFYLFFMSFFNILWLPVSFIVPMK